MPFYPLNADSCTSSYCPVCISHKIISFRLSNSANICLLVCLNLVEGDSWCIPIEKNHTLKRKISVAIQCHWKELLYCFEKQLTLRLNSVARVHHPVPISLWNCPPWNWCGNKTNNGKISIFITFRYEFPVTLPSKKKGSSTWLLSPSPTHTVSLIWQVFGWS